jgi:hypothetical protein
LLKTDQVPPGTTDPALTQTPQGALTVYYGALAQLRQSMGRADGRPYVAAVGLLTDELQPGEDMGSNTLSPEDLRTMTPQDPGPGSSSAYGGFQRIRGQTSQAIQLLEAYAPERRALIGHSYAVEGYAEVMLAELFCSGIPLSTLDYNGDYTAKAGSTTEQVLNHAIALFDTALTFAGDSARFVQLATVGKARAQLALGQFAEAAATVAQVPDDYRYEIAYSSTTSTTGSNPQNFAHTTSSGSAWPYSVADKEGGAGLDYRSSNDPRTSSSFDGNNRYGFPIYRPNKYSQDGTTPIVLASGIEARLIEAEAALNANPNDGVWLAKLNQLRETAITPALPDTSDPGIDSARVSLLFRERAFWLFLTGHRQGDLRRLIRYYGRTADQLYPTGPYPDGQQRAYGHDVTAPVSANEQQYNALYTGCFSRAA